MANFKILALFGKSGSGKDTIQKWMVSNIPNTKQIINCTTRAPRNYEQNGVHYYFITPSEFLQEMLDGKIIATTKFNNWFYGTRISELDENKINIGIFNIRSIECLTINDELDVLPVQIEADDITRLKRNLDRETIPDCTEICRRFLEDEKDYYYIPFNYVAFTNHNSSIDWFGIHNIPTIRNFINDIGQN